MRPPISTDAGATTGVLPAPPGVQAPGVDAPRVHRVKQADERWRGSLRPLFDLGVDDAATAAWLDDTLALAGAPPGFAGREAAPDALRQGVYVELEALERSRRATLLRHVARSLSRAAVASLPAATLHLVAPLPDNTHEWLREELVREGRRRVSERLARSARSVAAAFAFDRPPTDSPLLGEVARDLAALSAALDDSWEGAIVRAEVDFALGDLESARRRIGPTGGGDVEVAENEAREVSATREEAADPLSCGLLAEAPLTDVSMPGVPGAGSPGFGSPRPGDRFRTVEEAAADPVARLRTALEFVEGSAAAALERLESPPLVFDRSAALGTLRVVLALSLARPGAADAGRAPGPTIRWASRDEFDEPLGTSERRRIARFLAFAQTAKNGGAGAVVLGSGEAAHGVLPGGSAGA